MSITLNHIYPAARRPIVVSEGDEGDLIVRVGLAKKQSAVLDHADFVRLMAMGVSPNWLLGSDGDGRFYVRTKAPASFGRDNVVSVARLIVPPALRGVVVRYRDGDRLNLRRRNLELAEGVTKAHAWERDIVRAHLDKPAAISGIAAFA